MDGDIGLGPTTVALHSATPILFTPNGWREDGFDQQGNPYIMYAVWDNSSNEFYFLYSCNQGFGMAQVGLIYPVIWDGVTPSVLGPNNWQPYGITANGTLTAYVPY
jgi:hypothetical protein